MYLRRLPFRGQYSICAICDGRRRPLLLDFFNQLGPNLQKDMSAMLHLLEACAASGSPRNTEVSHKISGDIWEFIKGRLRILWFHDADKVIVCTNGFIKKTNKTPANEINRAQQAHQDYMAAKKRNELIIEEEHDG